MLPIVGAFFPLCALLGTVFVLLFLSFPVFPEYFTQDRRTLRFLLIARHIRTLPGTVVLVTKGLPPKNGHFGEFALPNHYIVFCVFRYSQLRGRRASISPSRVVPALFAREPCREATGIRCSRAAFKGRAYRHSRDPYLFVGPSAFVGIGV